MKTKSKALLLALCAVLLVTATVLGTMAYLTSTTDTVTNTFTVGKVKITLDEAKVDDNGKALTGNDAERVKANSYKLLPGHPYDKDPTVHVDANSEDCFIRAKVTVSNADKWQALATKYAWNDLSKIFTGFNDNIWWVSQPVVNADNTITYTFVYKNESHTDELGKRIWTNTDPHDLVLFTGITIPGEITGEEIATVANTTITVIAEAIQADGFATEAAAWGAFDAQAQANN